MRKQFNRDLITHLQGEGRTVFYSSHLLYEVEPVADEVAIIDDGRILRQAETEALRADVKQIVMRPELLPLAARHGKVLDQRPAGEESAVVVSGAEAVVDALSRDGAAHQVNDLNLDEIFEAYVAGAAGGGEGVVARDLEPAT